MRKSLQTLLLLKSFATGNLAPVLTLTLLTHGAELSTLSLMLGVFSLTVIVMEFPSGVFADLYGRKTAFLLSMALYMGCYALLLVADRPGLLALAMVINGLGRAFASGSLDAMALDQAADDAALVRVSARLSVLESAGLAAGALLGGVLAGIGGRYTANLLLNLCLYGVLFTVAARTLREPARPAYRHSCKTDAQGRIESTGDNGLDDTPAACVRGDAPGTRGNDCATGAPASSVAKAEIRHTPTVGAMVRQARESLAFAARPGRIRALFALSLVTGFSLLALETYWQPALSAFSPAPWLLGAVSCAGFGSVIVGSKLAERLLRARPGEALLTLFALKVLLGAGVYALALARGVGAYIAAYLGAYLFVGGGGVAESTLLNREAPSALRAGILSLFSFSLQFGGLLASLCGFAIVARSGYRTLWQVAGLGLLLTTVFFALLSLRRQAGRRQPRSQRTD